MADGHGCLDCGAPRYAYLDAKRGTRTASRCRDCANARRRLGYDATAQRSQSLKKRYGITEEQFQSMLAEQGGCAACGSTATDGKYWHVDHDHSCCDTQASSCGRCVRGVLCHGCNTALGNVKDSKARLAQLIAYLERFE